MREREPEQHIHAVLTGIANRARIDKEHRFGGLYTLLNKDFLRWCFYQLNRKASPGVDGTFWVDYERELEANLDDLVDRLKRKAYKARLVKRLYIPKGEDKFRPLGLLVQNTAYTTPTPNLKPLIGGFKVEPAVPWFVFWRPTSRLFLMPSRSVARPRRGGPEGRGRSAATASLVLIL